MDPSLDHSSSENLLQLAASELPVVIWQTDADLKFTASIGSGLTQLKLAPNEIVGQSLFDFFQSNDPEYLPIKIHRQALEGKAGSSEFRWGNRSYHFHVAPQRSSEGKITGCVGVAHDVSDLRQSQAALHESEARFRAITENTTELTLILAGDTTVKYVSPSVERISGHDRDAVQGRTAADFVHSDDLEKVLEALACCSSAPGETIFLSAIRMRHHDGQYHHYEGSLTALPGVPGVDGILVQCRDTTDRIRTEEQLDRSQAQWRSLVESAPEIIINVDLDGTITFINRTIAGSTPAEVVGTKFWDNVDDARAEEVRAFLEKVIQTGKADSYQAERFETTPPSWFLVRVAPIKREGDVVGLTLILTDITELKQKEYALRESEEKYRLLVDNQTDLVTQFCPERGLLYVSPSCCRAVGMTEEELQKTDFLSLIHEDDRQQVLDSVEEVFRPPFSSYNESRTWTVNGWRWLSWINTAVRNEKGEVEAVTGVGRDITERKETEQALRASEARFRAVFDHAATGIALATLDGRLLQWNPAFREMLGFTDEEMAKLGVRDFTFPEDMAEEVAAVRELRDGKRDALRFEKRYRRKDGSDIWGNVSCAVVRDERGEPSFVIGMVQDITERRRAVEDLRRAHDELGIRVKERSTDLAAANEKLREEIGERRQAEVARDESEKRFRLAFEESPWGMTIVGPDGRWLQVNRAFCEMLGYSQEELVGMSAAQVTHPDDLEWNSELARQLVEGEIPSFRFEKRYVRKDGRLVWTAINATVVRDDDGEVLYGLTMVEDITQRKHAQQALRRAERLSSIGTLAAGIAHEVNNPLGAIQLDADTALYCIGQPEKQDTVAACLKNIAASAQRGGQIVRDVLRFARSDRRPKTTDDLTGAVERACRLTRRLAEKRGVSIEFIPPAEELPVCFNGTEIEQVVVNLVTNAVQASQSGDRVEISLGRETNMACIQVRDFGRGMSPQEADRIFDPFFTTREGEGGTGLGLSITYGIVGEHEGTINVESCHGVGTTMTVRLPSATADVSLDST